MLFFIINQNTLIVESFQQRYNSKTDITAPHNMQWIEYVFHYNSKIQL